MLWNFTNGSVAATKTFLTYFHYSDNRYYYVVNKAANKFYGGPAGRKYADLLVELLECDRENETLLRKFVMTWMKWNGWSSPQVVVEHAPAHYTELCLALWHGPFPHLFRRTDIPEVAGWHKVLLQQKPGHLDHFFRCLAAFINNVWHNIRANYNMLEKKSFTKRFREVLGTHYTLSKVQEGDFSDCEIDSEDDDPDVVSFVSFGQFCDKY